MIIFIGPVFFLLIGVSLQLGTKAGILAALGIIVSDIICVSLCYYGVTAFLYQPTSIFWITLIGGLLLIFLGLKYILQPTTILDEKKEMITLHYISCFTKGFLVNFVNPFVFFVWIGVVSFAKENIAENPDLALYFSGVLLGILSTDLLKVFTAVKIQPALKPHILKYIYILSGILLVSFGIRILYLLH